MITEEDILILAPTNCTAAAKIDIIITFHFIIAMHQVGLALVRGASSECGQQDAPPYL